MWINAKSKQCEWFFWTLIVYQKLLDTTNVGFYVPIKHHPTIGDISSPTDICFGDVKPIPKKGHVQNPQKGDVQNPQLLGL